MGIILDLINKIEDKDEGVLYEEVCDFIDEVVKKIKYDKAMKIIERDLE